MCIYAKNVVASCLESLEGGGGGKLTEMALN